MNENEFNRKWNGARVDDMSQVELEEFKGDCFDLYEATGFLKRFDSPYDDEGEHNGMTFEVLRRAEPARDKVDWENLPLWEVRFENGDTALCYPEEITVLEHGRRSVNEDYLKKEGFVKDETASASINRYERRDDQRRFTSVTLTTDGRRTLYGMVNFHSGENAHWIDLHKSFSGPIRVAEFEHLLDREDNNEHTDYLR